MPKKITSKAQAKWAFAHAGEKGWAEEEIAGAVDKAGGMSKLPEKAKKPAPKGGKAKRPAPKPPSKVKAKKRKGK